MKMRRFVVVMVLVFCGLTNQDAFAQDFSYVPSGYDYGYSYRIDLGNGVDYGYAVGIGIPLPLEALTGSKTALVPQVQELCCDVVASTTSANDPAIATVVPLKSKPTAKLKAKKSEEKVHLPKPFFETKTAKPAKHLKAKTGKLT